MENFYESSISDSTYDHIKDHLIGLIEDIYESGNVADLEFHLEEVLLCFGLKIPKSTPILEKKITKDPVLNEWVEFNNNYLKSSVYAG